MASYVFDTITASQALAFSTTDSLTLPVGGSATATTILYLADGSYSMTVGARTVVFSPALQSIAQQLAFGDGTTLYIGGAQADLRDLGGTNASGAMYGGDGADSLTGGGGDWFIQGNQGNDVIGVRQDRANTVYGGQGDDDLTAGYGVPGLNPVTQFIQGNKGADTVFGGGTADTLLGGQGNDVMTGAGGYDFINGNLGDDWIVGSGQLFGEEGNDRITTADDLLSMATGGDGNDTLTGRSASDTLLGGNGNDSLDGGAGDNSLEGGGGSDVLTTRTYRGNNTLDGGDGDDLVQAGTGADALFGGSGNDQLVDTGGSANRLDAGSGNDSIFITSGTGTADCGDGNDTLDAINATSYVINGGAGNDLIRGSSGLDTIQGGDGADTIDDGGAADMLMGGAGADVFQFYTSASNNVTDARTPRIVDWAAEDRIQFHTNFAGQRPGYEERSATSFDAAVTLATETLKNVNNTIVSIQVGGDVLVFSGLGFGSGIYKAVLLSGRSLADISGDNFIV